MKYSTQHFPILQKALTRRDAQHFPDTERPGIFLLGDHFLPIHIQQIIYELAHITVFVQKLGRLGFQNHETLSRIQIILRILRSKEASCRYSEMVHILSKYLDGIRRFSEQDGRKGVIFYKGLFESAFIAIIGELEVLDLTKY